MNKRFPVLILMLAAVWSLVACGSETPAGKSDLEKKVAEPTASDETKKAGADKKETQKREFAGKPGRTLLVTQSQFAKDEKNKFTKPDAAVLLMLSHGDGKWSTEKIEDRESNVFHKAIQYDDEGILTVGAVGAKLKLWKKTGGKWSAETLWNPSWGGKTDRLRDFEIADFDGDGKKDLAIATHDQGVVAVVWHRGGEWKAEEIDRKADTFVHEIEIGDLDGDGKMEIYATPSQPNTASGHGQGGGVLRYAFDGEKFVKSEVVHYDSRHVKEVLVADVDGDGKKELYASLEAEMGESMKIIKPVEIRRFDWKGGKFESTKVTTINDRFLRFLVAGDVDGDGASELIASAFSAGVWVIDKKGDNWESNCIDKKTGGFEHATYLADMNDDDKLELYVADDNGGVVRQYIFNGESYDSRVISKRLVPAKAMTWNITVADI